MSSGAGISILDEALACIGQRVAAILIHPADKDKTYIASLRNEVVGIFTAKEDMKLIQGFVLACCGLD